MRKYYLLLFFLGILLSTGQIYAHVEDVSQSIQKTSKVRKEKPRRMNPAKAKKAGLPIVHKAPQRSISLAYQPKKIYGYLIYDDEINDLSICHFNLNDLSTINIIEMGSSYYPNIVCGAYGNGQYYYYGCDDDGYALFFASVDLKTNKRTIINDYELEDYFLAYDMTFDYSTQTMYALVSTDDGDSSSLVTVDLTDGHIESEVYLEDYYVALAATYDGTMYAMSLYGELHQIDKAEGTAELILETDIASDYICAQSMDFDHTDESLYWTSYIYHDDGECYESALIKINVEEANFDNLGVVGGNAEICGLYIPFVRNNLNAPAEASEVTLTPDINGENSADLSWTNPGKTLNEDPLTELTKVEVYRSDNLVKTFEKPAVGVKMTFKDTDVITGLYTYKIVAYNAEGDGVPATVTGFVGHDVPEAVSELTLSKENERIGKLTWKAPIKGVHGGWIDIASLVYNIIRYPDKKTVASELAANEFTDNSLTALNNYYYTVEATTADGVGGISESNKELIGKALTLPYETAFNIEEKNQWTINDANSDGKTWTFDTYLADYFFRDKRDGAYYYGSTETADEYLISSPITLEGSKSYRVSLDAEVSVKGESATLEVTVGKGTDIASQKVITAYLINNISSETRNVSIIGLEDGEYNIGLHLKTTGADNVRVVGFGVDKCVASYISGIVSSEQQPLSNALIEVKKKDNAAVVASTLTNAKGEYTLPYIEKGEYILSVTLGGYENPKKELAINEPEILTMNLELMKAQKVTIIGSIKDEKDLPVVGASVLLKGTLSYQVTTKEDGTFEIVDITLGKYDVTVYKNSYEQQSLEVEISADKTLDVVTLVRKVLAPSEVTADIADNHPVITWNEPVDHKIFRYDNGKQVRDYGINGGSYYGVIGSVYRQPAKLTAASWFIIDDGYDDHDLVNLFIFDLDSKGEPTNRILYKQDEIKNNNGNWTTYAFEQPIDCPNGFLVALSVDGGYLALGATEADNDYPFIPETQCSSRDYENEGFYYLEELDATVKSSFMLRAEGIPTGAPINHSARMISTNKQKVKAIMPNNLLINRGAAKPASLNIQLASTSENSVYPVYNVYRLKTGEEEQTDKWTLLTQQPISTFTYTDQSWNTLSQGYYKYAVQAVYTNNRLSEMALSEALGKDMRTNIIIHVTTNVDGVSTQGASVKLTDKENSYTATADASGTVTFNSIPKGTYQISIRLKGCKEYVKEMDCSANDSYTADIQLLENLVSPHGLTVSAATQDNKYQFSWNEFMITDGFEDHPDFAINSAGNVGWSYIDGDGSVTQGFKDGSTGEWYEFDNMFSPMAFIVFNPSTVLPNMEREFQAHSGNKFLACLAGETANDDYLISPELDGSDSFIFKFFALSYDGTDRMEVGYSFNRPSAEEFTWGSGIVNITAAKEWNEYSYEIPAGVRYVAIRCISPSPLIFMIDDVCISTDKEKSQAIAEGLGAHKYEIYLDGEKVATQSGISYQFTNLSTKEHTAGIKAIYASGASELVTVTFNSEGNSIDNPNTEEVVLYPNPVKDYLHIKGETDKIEIYTLSGILVGNYIAPLEIPVSNLEDGIYTVRIITKSNIAIKKMIVKK